MRPRLLAALAALNLAACVTEDVAPPGRTWELTTDQPLVSVADPPLALPPGPSGNAAATNGAAPNGAGPNGAQDAGPPPATQPESAPQDAPPAASDDLLNLLHPATLDTTPDYLSGESPTPFHRLGRNVIRGIDGSWSKMYSLKKERTNGIIALLQHSVPNFPTAPSTPSPADAPPSEVMKYSVQADFFQDSTFSGQADKLGVLLPLPKLAVSDLLVITAPPEVLLFVDQLMDKLLGDLPQIELQVRVVEVNLDDLIEWDSKVGVQNLENPDLPFNSATNPPAGNFGAGFPILDNNGTPTGYGAAFGSFAPPGNITGFLLSLQGVHNGWQVDSLLSFLQTIGASELIISPTVTVLNGHRAIINTGSKVPVFSATGLGTNAQVTTTFQDTGVKVEMIPFIVSDDIIRIDVSVDVSAVTSEVPFVLSGIEVSTPVISTRDTGTTVHVHSGQVFAVGGLRSRETIETITKVPLLGDIPILGWLFKSRASRVRNSEILFFVTPTIRIPSESLIAPLGP